MEDDEQYKKSKEEPECGGAFNGGNVKYLTTVYDSLYGKERRSVTNALLNIIIAFFCVVLAVELIFNSFFTGIYVVNVSMTPTFTGAPVTGYYDDGTEIYGSGGDFIYVSKTAKPDYGDVVVVYRETTNSRGQKVKGNIIKRVVAFGGDTVEIKGGVLILNGNEVDEPYVDPSRNTPLLNNYGEHTVKEGCMFLLGDNRNESTDSRDNGDYPQANLVGVVPQWSINVKSFTTAIYTFFNYTLTGKK